MAEPMPPAPRPCISLPIAPLLSTRDLSVRYRTDGGDVRAVDRLSLDVAPGESLGLVGESGSGKSTLALAIMGLLPSASWMTDGSVWLDGRRISDMSDEQLQPLRWTKMAMVFQKAMNALSPVHRVRTHVLDIYRVHRPEASTREALDRAGALFAAVGLRPPGAGPCPHELSGGQLQRVAIARAMLLEPDFVVANEPVSILDVSVRAEILNFLLDLRADRGTAFLFITHDIGVARYVSDRIAVMYLGRVVEEGPAEEVIRDPLHPYTLALVAGLPDPEIAGGARPRSCA